MNVIQHCFICRPSDSTVSENAGIEPWTVATMALTARRSTIRLYTTLLLLLSVRIIYDLKQILKLNVPNIDMAHYLKSKQKTHMYLNSCYFAHILHARFYQVCTVFCCIPYTSFKALLLTFPTWVQKPFLKGPFHCTGQQLGYSQVKKMRSCFVFLEILIPKLLCNFKINSSVISIANLSTLPLK
jgi:hypothetical protein